MLSMLLHNDSKYLDLAARAAKELLQPKKKSELLGRRTATAQQTYVRDKQ